MASQSTNDLIAKFRIEVQSFNGNQTFLKPRFCLRRDKTEDLNWVDETLGDYVTGHQAILFDCHFPYEFGPAIALEVSPSEKFFIVSHSSGLTQVRDTKDGSVIKTLLPKLFPWEPINCIRYNQNEEDSLYACSSTGNIYRIRIPENLEPEKEKPLIPVDSRDKSKINILTNENIDPFLHEKAESLSIDFSASGQTFITGSRDCGVRIYDANTKQTIITYKAHQSRIASMDKSKLRWHANRVMTARCHPDLDWLYATGSWDDTTRLWDHRVGHGCIMTFNSGPICGDAIDLCRQRCITASWRATESLNLWDMRAKKRMFVVKVQNRRPNIDGEFLYAGKFWRNLKDNRKGKYVLIGGSGTRCLEAINVHDRTIRFAVPAPGGCIALSSRGNTVVWSDAADRISGALFHDPMKVAPETDFDTDTEAEDAVQTV